MTTNTDLVIFGAMGDLSARKLYRALFHLDNADLLPKEVNILGLARNDVSVDEFKSHMESKLREAVYESSWSDQVWERFSARLDYIVMDFTNPEDFSALSERLHADRTNIFYLATPPSIYMDICHNLGKSDCVHDTTRIVLEKPIGSDLETCKAVNATVAEYFSERQIYRIDHYLGKETVQNLLVLRFANRFINTQWDQGCIDHVQITVAEMVGIEGRWSYYDKVGQLRDMVQNHLLQLLCLVAMEPPNSMTAEGIRDEKVKILRALRRVGAADVADHSVRGQYSQGWYKGNPAPGYMDEEGCVNKKSDTETFVALKAYIDNWRWSGVPFYLRTGKRMPDKLTEIVIVYKSLPHNIFSNGANIPNRLVIRLQPNEGIEMQMVSKKHSLKHRMALERHDLSLDFLGTAEMDRIPDAYERLFLDVINGDQSLFVGREEVEEAWRWCDTIIESWGKQATEVKPYSAGSWGPAKAELLIERDGRSWNE